MNDVSVYMDTEEVQPSNPFLKQEQNENNLLDIAMQVLATITARKAPRKMLLFVFLDKLFFIVCFPCSSHFSFLLKFVCLIWFAVLLTFHIINHLLKNHIYLGKYLGNHIFYFDITFFVPHVMFSSPKWSWWELMIYPQCQCPDLVKRFLEQVLYLCYDLSYLH